MDNGCSTMEDLTRPDSAMTSCLAGAALRRVCQSVGAILDTASCAMDDRPWPRATNCCQENLLFCTLGLAIFFLLSRLFSLFSWRCLLRHRCCSISDLFLWCLDFSGRDNFQCCASSICTSNSVGKFHFSFSLFLYTHHGGKCGSVQTRKYCSSSLVQFILDHLHAIQAHTILPWAHKLALLIRNLSKSGPETFNTFENTKWTLIRVINLLVIHPHISLFHISFCLFYFVQWGKHTFQIKPIAWWGCLISVSMAPNLSAAVQLSFSDSQRAKYALKIRTM